MSIGDGPDYYDGINREEDKRLEFHCICGNCKHYNFDEDYCMGSGKHEIYEEDTCEYWEDENVLTKEDEDAIIGDREAHRRMVEGEDLL